MEFSSYKTSYVQMPGKCDCFPLHKTTEANEIINFLNQGGIGTVCGRLGLGSCRQEGPCLSSPHLENGKRQSCKWHKFPSRSTKGLSWISIINNMHKDLASFSVYSTGYKGNPAPLQTYCYGQCNGAPGLWQHLLETSTAQTVQVAWCSCKGKQAVPRLTSLC